MQKIPLFVLFLMAIAILIGCLRQDIYPIFAPFEIWESDNGRTFTYLETARMMFVLDEDHYPMKNFSCSPPGVIGTITDAPAQPLPFYALHFEAVGVGGVTVCKNGDFQVAVRVVANEWYNRMFYLRNP